uniref:Uncharacterized protein n=1 Tax=Arundo donax TaxID=35708 RepID=A0A0A9D0F3_ARUDO
MDMPSLPEPEEELRPGTAMVSSRPEGEVAPITRQCKHDGNKREMRGRRGASKDKHGLERSRSLGRRYIKGPGREEWMYTLKLLTVPVPVD